MIEKIYRFTCADCKLIGEYKNKDAAQAIGWAIKRGGKECYCPSCAVYHRSTGCKGAAGVQQLKIS